MSLQSTYQSRKELLVENLETMGVTDYSADDGLTTLINAVLEIAPVPPTPTPSSISLTGTKSILSYADSEQSVLTATVLDANDDPVEGVSVDLYKDSVLWDTISTGSDGTVSKTYSSTGAGDVSFTAEVGSLVSEIYELQDYLRYDLATSDKTSSYGACITYRGNGTATWSYSANNGYRISITNSTEGMSVLSELTGKNNFTVEFDGKMLTSSSGTNYAIGLCAYEDNNNYSRISLTNLKIAQRVSINGTATESESNLDNSININQLIHFKYTIANNQIVEEITQGTTVIGTRTISYTTTANTKFGICGIWQKSWAENNYFTNIKVKPL